MVTVKQAVESAAAFAKGILGDERTAGLQLEEVELGKYMDKDAWQITLSMLRPNSFGQSSNYALGPALTFFRDYKTLTVDRENR